MENNLPPSPSGPPGPPPAPGAKNLLEGLKKLAGKIHEAAPPLAQAVRKGFAEVLKDVEEIWAPLEAKLPLRAQEVSRKHRRKIFVGVTVVAVLCLVSVARNIFLGKPKMTLDQVVSQQEAAQEAPVSVKGFKVGRFNFEDTLNALGTMKGAVEFKLSFEIPGVISSINYREGERYEEGALLVSLRQDDILLRLKRAQAEFNKAQTQVQIAEDKVREHEKIFALGGIPQTTLDKVKLEMDAAKFDAEAARLEAKAHEAMLEKSNLYAPSAGMLGEISVEEGETVTQNSLIGKHVMTEYVFAEFGVVERDVSKIALGQKARIFIDAFAEKTFEGVVENLAPVVAGTSRTATARVRIENPDRVLLPGMFARVRILLYSKKNTLVVPTDAIQGGEGEKFVFVVHPDKGVVEKRAVTVGYTRPDYSQIDAGLAEGELAAISGFERLEDGKKIRLLETQEAEV